MNEEPILQGSEPRAVSLDAETRYAPNGIVSRTVFQCGAGRVTLFGFAQGEQLSQHTSTRHALIQILSGESQWTVNGRAQTLGAGQLLHLPPGTPHAVRAARPFSMLLTLLTPD